MRSQKKKEKDAEDKDSYPNSEEMTDEGRSSNTERDHDSVVSFMNDTDEELDTAEIEEKDWAEYTKRSTKEAEEQMRLAQIPCWIEPHRRVKWRSAMRTASIPETRRTRKAAEWNPGLRFEVKTCRAAGRPKKDGRTKSTTSSNQRKLKRKMAMT